jgi:hypothetical protein
VLTLSGTARHHYSLAASANIGVNVEAGCGWTAASDALWLTITSGSPGDGAGTVAYSVAANTQNTRRTATVTIGVRTFVVTQAGAAAVPSAFDINGDGKADLWWRHQTAGWVAAWQMDDHILVDALLTSPSQVSDINWNIVGTGDFNGDGHPDLFWQHRVTRLMTVWLMNGTTFIGPGLLNQNTVSDTNWEIRSIADLNADGWPDLVWQHRTEGLIAVWYMNGLNLQSSRLLTPSRVADTNWKIVGAGDFNGDGDIDLFWQNQVTRLMTVWLMDGADFQAAGLVTPNTVADTQWQIAAVVDLNADGHPDLVWQHTGAGALVVWFMNGTALVEGRALSPSTLSDRAWQIVGPR